MTLEFDETEHKRVFHLDPQMSSEEVRKHFWDKKCNYFVFCSAKSGSSNLHHSLRAKGIKSIHTHGNYNFQLDNKVKYTIFDLVNYNSRIFPDEKFYFIDSYRTPIERKISSFFQNNEPLVQEKTTEEVIEIFNKLEIYRLENYHSIDQILRNNGIPLFEKFDFEKGYNIASKDNKIFIKLLFRDINSWGKILEEVLGLKLEMKPVNITEGKKTAAKYKEFKEKYKVPTFYLDHVLVHDPHFLVYNTEEQRKNYIAEWNKKSYVQENTPVDFDPVVYRAVNKDIRYLNLHEAACHYKLRGSEQFN